MRCFLGVVLVVRNFYIFQAWSCWPLDGKSLLPQFKGVLLGTLEVPGDLEMGMAWPDMAK